jgi:hypothetical protein
MWYQALLPLQVYRAESNRPILHERGRHDDKQGRERNRECNRHRSPGERNYVERFGKRAWVHPDGGDFVAAIFLFGAGMPARIVASA